jgi:hypothetical protein
MRKGDLVAFRYFKNYHKNASNLGVVLDIQTGLVVPRGYAAGFDCIDLMNVSWVTEESYEVIPYFKLGIAGKRWYLKKQFYIIS